MGKIFKLVSIPTIANSVSSGAAPAAVTPDAALRLETRRPPVRHPDEGRRRRRDEGLPQEREEEDALLIIKIIPRFSH